MKPPAYLLPLVLALAAPALAAEPAIRNVNLRGLSIGAKTTLVIDGDDLSAAPKLLLPFAAEQALAAGSTEKKATFEVTLPADVVPGYYQLRVVTGSGVSLPVLIGVDQLPQLPLGKTIEKLPAALHGVAAGSSASETSFTGKAGEKVLVEIEAQRLGSKLRPVVHLVGPNRRQIGWSWPAPALFGDTRLEATLPADGAYTIALHDAEYAAPNPSYFRLKVGQWSFVDEVFPPAVTKGQAQAIELLGISPAAKLDLPASSTMGVLPLDWPKGNLWSGPRPFVVVGSQPEFVEQPQSGPMVPIGQGAPNSAASQATSDRDGRTTFQDLPAGKIAVSGRLSAPFEEDKYRLAVVPGSKLKLDVFAERYGSPLDVAIVVRNEKGDQLVRGEDGPGTVDPSLEYTVPANVNQVIVGVTDALGRGSPRGVYRLIVEPILTRSVSEGAPGSSGDFQLTTTIQRISLPVGGRAVVPVFIERRGYAGSIDLASAMLPAGVAVENATIPAGADGTLAVLARGEAPAEPVVATLRGKTAGGDESVVTIKSHPLERLQPWLASEIAIAPTTAKGADFQVDWRDLAADAGLVPTQKLTLPVKFVRGDENTAVRLSLVTSQLEPLAGGRPDPNKTLRLEKAVEIGAKVADGEAVVLVPADLASPVYDVTLQAELLSADKKTVLATAYAPVRRMEVRQQVLLTLDGPPRIEAPLDPKSGATVKVTGKVERREGFAGEITLALIGPAAVKATVPAVKADASTFELTLTVPAAQPLGEIPLKLSGTFVPDPKQANARVKTRDLDLTLVLTPPAPAAATPAP